MKKIGSVLISILLLIVILFGFDRYHRHIVSNYITKAIAHQNKIKADQVKVDKIKQYGSLLHQLNPFSPKFWSVEYTLPEKTELTSAINIEELNFGKYKIQNKPYSAEEMKRIIESKH